MIVYIQKKINNKWITILPIDEVDAPNVCGYFKTWNPMSEYRIVEKP